MKSQLCTTSPFETWPNRMWFLNKMCFRWFFNYWWGNPKKIMFPYLEKRKTNQPSPLENQLPARHYCMCWMAHFIQSGSWENMHEERQFISLSISTQVHEFKSFPLVVHIESTAYLIIFLIFPITWIRRMMCGIVSITLREPNLLFICTKIGSVCIGS